METLPHFAFQYERVYKNLIFVNTNIVNTLFSSASKNEVPHHNPTHKSPYYSKILFPNNFVCISVHNNC